MKKKPTLLDLNKKKRLFDYGFYEIGNISEKITDENLICLPLK